MAEPATDVPTTWQEVFDIIFQESLSLVDSDSFETYISDRIQESRKYFPFMRGSTTEHYYEYHAETFARETRASAAEPGPTAQQFWRAAYEFDYLARHDGDLVGIINTEKLKRVTIGKLHGTRMALEPELGALHDSEAAVRNIPLPRLPYPRAISYASNHPSESGFAIKVWSDQDTLLRRFLCLGWVVRQDGPDLWTKTGHALVVDLDKTPNKKRHPWFVLATQWPDDYDRYPDSLDGLIHAPEFVEQDPVGYLDGVLPSTNERTTVARLRSRQLELQGKKGTYLQYFGDDFEFELTRFGLSGEQEQRNDPRYLKGTYLSVIMEVYWNTTTNEEICYNEDKLVFFRYHRPSGAYSYIQPEATDNFSERVEAPKRDMSEAMRGGFTPSYAKRRRERFALQAK